ncbi:formin-1-like [Amia ocellicauda]|uniref:formin-1-like n=1 Tax=Amia ocellicauda TaxID=2972642 RepID=UPI003463CE47
MMFVMEGTHTVHRLHKPIKERCHISCYVPRGRIKGFTYKGRAATREQPIHCYDQRKEEPGEAKQKDQYCETGGEHLNLTATKSVVSEFYRLTAEHQGVLTDLIALCANCKARFEMGNQDAKLQGYLESGSLPVEGEGELLSSRDLQESLSLSTECKKGVSKGRKLKKLVGMKADSAEVFMQSKIKRKVNSGIEFSSDCLSKGLPMGKDTKALGKPVSRQGPKTSAAGSCTSLGSGGAPAPEGHQSIEREGWDFVEDSRNFESDTDICSELSEYDNELLTGYVMSCSSSFLEDMPDNLRHAHQQTACGYVLGTQGESSLPGQEESVKKIQKDLAHKRLADPCQDEVHTREQGLRVFAKVQNVEGLVQKVCQSDAVEFKSSVETGKDNLPSVFTATQSTLLSKENALSVPELKSVMLCDRTGEVTFERCLGATVPKDESSGSGGVVIQSGVIRNDSFEETEEGKALRKRQTDSQGAEFDSKGALTTKKSNPELLRLPLQNPADAPPGNGSPKALSPSSPSLAAVGNVFNTSYPANNNLQCMSPVPSPLSSKLPSPQLNHRILLLPQHPSEEEEEEVVLEKGCTLSIERVDESRAHRATTEIIDKNGNKRTITRLELNVTRLSQEHSGNQNGSRVSFPDAGEDAFLKQDEIWLLEADDSICQSHDSLSRSSRPDHLDFLRITPAEECVATDTSYYTHLEFNGTEACENQYSHCNTDAAQKQPPKPVK